MTPTASKDGPTARRRDVADLAHDLTESLTALPALLMAPEPVEETLERVAILCCSTLPGCDHAAVLIKHTDGSVRAAASSDGPRTQLDQVQLDAGRGPCIEAMTGDTVVKVSVPDSRWPEFSEAAGAAGMKSALAVPIPPQGPAEGSLNLFSREDEGLDDLGELVASMFAAQCALAISSERARERAVALSHQMQEALTSRAAIDQAKGIVMEREGCNAEEAFQRLVARSQGENRKVRDVALALVAEVSAGS